MAGLRVQLSDELEKLFRKIAMKRFGYGRGSLSRAAEEAIRRWGFSCRRRRGSLRGILLR